MCVCVCVRVCVCQCVLPDKCVMVAESGEGTMQILPEALLGRTSHPQ